MANRTALRKDVSGLLAHKKRLLNAQLDGHDVFERGLVPVLLSRIGDRLAPTAAEVSRHSPNREELSLKLEKEGGRREEVYLKKAELAALVAPLPPEAQQLFAKLAFLPAIEASRAPHEVSVEVDLGAIPDSRASSVPPAAGSVPPPSGTSRPSALPPPRRKW